MKLLAIDQGTTSSRSILFDAGCHVLGTGQQEFPQVFPRPGWVEHDPMAIWESQSATWTALERPDAIGITNQRETVVLWERATGRPLANAIVWQDRRTAARCDDLKAAGAEEMVRAKTGLCLDPYFSGTKIAWLLDHTEGARERAARGELAVGTIDSWLIWHLTGGRVHATDASNASRTMLYNLHTGEWDPELLALLDVPRELLPAIVASSGVVAEASVPGLEGVPIAGIAGDQQAALFGQACFEPGMVKNTYGTGCFMLLHTGDQPATSRHGLLSTVAWRIGDRTEFALEGSVFMGGAIVQWLRDGLGLIERASEIEALAAQVTSSDGVVLIPAFTGLGAPHWRPDVRGSLTGLTRGTTRAHIARAAHEAIVLQCADLLAAMREDASEPIRELRVDGGAAANQLLLQLQADQIGARVVRPLVLETTALGAAALAGLGIGAWSDRAAFAATWSEDVRFEPAPDASTRSARKHWDQALQTLLQRPPPDVG